MTSSEDPSTASDPRAERAGKRVILVDGDADQVRRIARVLRTAVEDLEVASSLDPAMSSPRWDLLVANYDSLDAGAKDRLFSMLRERGRLLIYSNHVDRDELRVLFGTRGLTNLLAKNPEVDGDELLVTIQKILKNDIFGLGKYFPWGTAVVKRTMCRSTEKETLIDDVRAFASNASIQTRMVEMFCTVADELLTNAIYNAPVDEHRAPRFAHLPRTHEVVLGDGERVAIEMQCDGRRLGIAVDDPFGSLSAEKVLDYLAKCFRRGEDQVDQKAGGAGLGLYYVFEALSHFVVNVAKGQRTEMIGLMDIRGSYRDFAARSKSFNIFVAD